MPTTLTDATFDEEIAGSAEPVLVDFWAEWCGPCKMIAPILDQIGEEQAGKLKIAKLNVDDNPDVARRFDVMSIPTLIVFQDGQPVKRMVGAKGKGQLLEELQDVLARRSPQGSTQVVDNVNLVLNPETLDCSSRVSSFPSPARQAGGPPAVIVR